MLKLKLCVEFNGLDIIGHSQHAKHTFILIMQQKQLLVPDANNAR